VVDDFIATLINLTGAVSNITAMAANITAMAGNFSVTIGNFTIAMCNFTATVNNFTTSVCNFVTAVGNFIASVIWAPMLASSVARGWDGMLSNAGVGGGASNPTDMAMISEGNICESRATK
jgi:hypothetical protein